MANSILDSALPPSIETDIFGGRMEFLVGLMAITFWGIALPIYVLGLIGTWFLSAMTYGDKLLGWKTLFGLLCLGAIAWLADLNWTSVFSRWTLVYMAGWLLAGAVWFLFKWNQFVGRQRAEAGKALTHKLHEGRAMNEAEKRAFMLVFKPDLDQNKERAFSWIILWPFSVLAYIFGDLLKDLVDWIIERLRGVAKLITARHFGEFEATDNKSGE